MRQQVQEEQTVASFSADSLEKRLYHAVRQHRTVALEQIQLYPPDSLLYQGVQAVTRFVFEEQDSLSTELFSEKVSRVMKTSTQKEESQSEWQALGHYWWYIVIILFFVIIAILWNKRHLLL